MILMLKYKSMFNTQIDYIFNRPITKIEWYFGNDPKKYPFKTAEESFEFMEELFTKPNEYLQEFSDDQIGLGLNYIFSNSCSELVEDFKRAKIDYDRKIKFMYSLNSIHKEIFETRATEKLLAGSKDKLSLLDYIVYMFWDINPITEPIATTKGNQEKYINALGEVIEQALYLKNIACIESGLHGLGHLAYKYPTLVEPIIDNFLAQASILPELNEYAKQARTGMIA